MTNTAITKSIRTRKTKIRINYYMVVQKLLGLILIVSGIIIANVNEDRTAAAMLFMFGLPVILTKEKVLLI